MNRFYITKKIITDLFSGIKVKKSGKKVKFQMLPRELAFEIKSGNPVYVQIKNYDPLPVEVYDDLKLRLKKDKIDLNKLPI